MNDMVRTTISVGGGEPVEIDLSKRREAAAIVKKAMNDKADENQREAFTPDETGQTVAAGQLRAFVERIERLEEDKKTIGEDIKEVYAELKGTGFDTKAVRSIVKLRKKDQAQRQEEETILELYMNALGMA